MGKFTTALRAEVTGYDNTEWTGRLGGEEVTLFAKPATSADMERISNRHPGFLTQPSMGGMIDMIILKATDSDGESAFDKGDRIFLMRMSTDKIGEIFRTLFGKQFIEDDDEAFEDRVGNSNGTSGS